MSACFFVSFCFIFINLASIISHLTSFAAWICLHMQKAGDAAHIFANHFVFHTPLCMCSCICQSLLHKIITSIKDNEWLHYTCIWFCFRYTIANLRDAYFFADSRSQNPWHCKICDLKFVGNM
jgi:hypothetical protein